MGEVFTIVNDDSDNTLSNVITDYQASSQFEKDQWGNMVRHAVDCTGGFISEDDKVDAWQASYTEAEQVQVDRREANGEVIKRTKSGKIVASAAFPKTWNTDKTIVGKALDSGCSLLDDEGNPKAKTALQDEYKEANADKDDKSALEKLITVANTWNSLFDQLTTDDEREMASALLKLKLA